MNRVETGSHHIAMPVKGCISCAPKEKDQNRILFVSEFCRVVLRIDPQPYFARAVIHPEEHISSLFSADENPALSKRGVRILADIYHCRRVLQIAYKKMFGMTRDNWVQAGNLDKDENGLPTSNPERHHTHYHMIPRFEKPVTWEGMTFTDKTFTKALSIDPAHFNEGLVKLSADQIAKLKEDIQIHLLKEKIVTVGSIEAAFPSAKVFALISTLKQTAAHAKPQGQAEAEAKSQTPKVIVNQQATVGDLVVLDGGEKNGVKSPTLLATGRAKVGTALVVTGSDLSLGLAAMDVFKHLATGSQTPSAPPPPYS